MEELGQQTVEFSTLVTRAAEESFRSLKELVGKSKSSNQSDTEKKIDLLKYIVKNQQRMLRLNVLAKWCKQVNDAEYCSRLYGWFILPLIVFTGNLTYTLAGRNGRYLLQSSKDIIMPSALLDAEEALNQGNISATEVFVTLRSKSILHLFASIGKFLGLQVYEHGLAAVKIPKNILNSSSFLLMGFPDCSIAYFC
ncbi:hypothetical protein Nepgr_001445 [Nepenthes gracilis]|uniref:Mediator of RNA polymerase II transcription subunit 14 n=1 Tax=Nepenthes gracilis TaxID=150966 RepID=A0AAD3P4H3_NEPGR|nr:hypothetical protein Nepgr_001445 [Nepenthes gracilis]